jgi:hypothetical protein
MTALSKVSLPTRRQLLNVRLCQSAVPRVEPSSVISIGKLRVCFGLVSPLSQICDGSIRSDDGLLDLKLALPKTLRGKGAVTNPEQLFAEGYAACF